LRYDLKVDLPLTAAASIGWIVSEAFKGHLAPANCHWCVANDFDDAARQSLRWRSTGTADTLSSVTAFALAPLVVGAVYTLAATHDRPGRDMPWRDLFIDGVLVVEATALALDLNQVVKFSVGRERPYVHALPAADKRRTADPADNNTSFFSFHATFAFALATSASTLAFLRRHRWAGWVLGAGLTVATTTAYLRVAADRHYLSDVLTSAAVGSAVGFGVPWVFHRRAPEVRSSAVRLVPLAAQGGGAGVSLLWVR
jgi:membrane-associated phospholipid phosphatase